MSLIIPANTLASGGYEVDNSVRLDGTSAYLKKTPSSAGNRQKWTWSGWVKRSSNFAAQQTLFGVSASSSTYHLLYFSGNDTITHNYQGTYIETNAKYRDPSAWYHIVLAVDTTQGTNTNRLKLYVNGTQVTSFSASGYPSQNTEMNINNTVQHDVANSGASYNHYINGYMAEVCFINNQQLDPTSFGEFDEDSGIWKPIDVSGLTFGTNGFYLDFEDSANLGNDANGGTDLTEVNLAAIDQSTDTCTNNFATWNPLALSTSAPTLSEGNLKSYVDGSAWKASPSTMAMSKGKFYMEIKWVSDSNTRYAQIGIVPSEQWEQQNSGYPQVSDMDNGYTYYSQDGTIYNNGSSNSYGNSYGSSNIVGIALDCDNNKLYFSKDGTWQNSGNPESGSTGTGAFSIADKEYYFILTSYAVGNIVFEANFGSPSFAISSGNTDGDGYGNFEYAVPSGYYALNTKNLSEYG